MHSVNESATAAGRSGTGCSRWCPSRARSRSRSARGRGGPSSVPRSCRTRGRRPPSRSRLEQAVKLVPGHADPSVMNRDHDEWLPGWRSSSEVLTRNGPGRDSIALTALRSRFSTTRLRAVHGMLGSPEARSTKSSICLGIRTAASPASTCAFTLALPLCAGEDEAQADAVPVRAARGRPGQDRRRSQ